MILGINHMSSKTLIPKDWQRLHLGDVARVTNGKTNSQDAVIDGNYPLFDRSVLIKKSDKFIFDGEAIILPGEGAEFIPRYFSGKFDLHQRAYAIFSDDEKVYSPYLYYFLFANRDIFAQTAVGSTVKSLRLPIIQKVSVNIPPLEEQKGIAEILQSVDAEIQKLDLLISETEKIKKGLVIKLFSDQQNNNKYKIGDISEVTSSKRVMVSDYVDSGIPFYRSTEIIKKSKNIPVTDPYYISQEQFDSFKNRFGAPEKGDILVTAVGTIGDVYLVQKETFYFKDGNTIWIRKIKDIVSPEYLRMILASSYYREKLNSVAGGSNQKALTIQKMESVEVPIPSIKEQQRLVEILSSIEEKTDMQVILRKLLTKLKIGLMSDLLSGKVRVK
jgi:type I restriction enzyme S subunit